MWRAFSELLTASSDGWFVNPVLDSLFQVFSDFFDVDALKQEAEEKGFNVLRTGEPLGSQGRAPAIYVEDPFGYKLELKEEE
ncbi:MAG: VOC family protein [Candidatus Nanohalobium sp.]